MNTNLAVRAATGCALALALSYQIAPHAARADEPADETAEYDADAPDEDFVWEDGDELEDGSKTDGFYRRRTVAGATWVPGHYEGRVWVAPDWRPNGGAKHGQVWVHGRRGRDGYWVAGQWRPATRAGFTWTPGRVVGGVWVDGDWVPLAPRTGEVWVRGHWDPRGAWVDGFWRPAARREATWVDGHWRYGRWVPGHWQPTVERAGEVWVPGHTSPRGWVDGFWRPAAKPGHYWVATRWVNGVWAPGRWAVGRAPVVARRHRVRPVAAMVRTQDRRLWREGKVQERRGEAQERRGEALQERGERRGNEQMEERGERVEQRGKTKQRRGDRKQKRATK